MGCSLTAGHAAEYQSRLQGPRLPSTTDLLSIQVYADALVLHTWFTSRTSSAHVHMDTHLRPSSWDIHVANGLQPHCRRCSGAPEPAARTMITWDDSTSINTRTGGCAGAAHKRATTHQLGPCGDAQAAPHRPGTSAAALSTRGGAASLHAVQGCARAICKGGHHR